MTHSFLSLVIYALATFRLTRLLTTDEIFSFLREFLRKHAFVVMERRNLIQNNVEERAELPKVRSAWTWFFKLVSCDWCMSVWTGGGVVALAKYQGSWFFYVAIALALSSVVGFLSHIEARLNGH